jgi:16S rRNA (adenine1518-N6/adenine1519-N6)-dimethyltransferase
MILNWVLECDIIEKIVVMLQKEVAVRFTAKEGSKDYGIPSVLLQRYFDIKIKINVSPNNFFPKPNVDSAVLLFERNKAVFDLEEFLFVQKFVSTLFQSRRKKIRSSVVKIIENLGANSEAILGFLNEKETESLDKRIEALSVEEIFAFAQKLKSLTA